jgi:hypothetical protein
MVNPTVAARMGRINGLQRETPNPGRRVRFQRAAQTPLIGLGSVLYAVALVFPLLLKQVNPVVFGAAFLGTALVLAGLHVRWTRPTGR